MQSVFRLNDRLMANPQIGYVQLRDVKNFETVTRVLD